MYDMTGNVWEGVGDLYDEGYKGKNPKYNRKGPRKSAERVIRGGSWFDAPAGVRTAY